MAYDKHTWTCDEPITVERLNHIEDGIANAGGDCDCGYECTENVTTIEETVTTVLDGIYNTGMLSYSQLIDVESIKITFNGTEYECPIIVAPYGNVYGGVNQATTQPDFSQYPFAIFSSATMGNQIITETAGTHTVKIEIEEETITTTPCFDKARGYSCVEEIATLTEETVITTMGEGGNAAQGDLSYSQPIIQDTITVTFNGTEYECPRLSDGSYGAPYDQSTSTFDWSEYPFTLYSDSFDSSIYTETAGTYSVKIEGMQEVATTTQCFEKAVQSIASPLVVKASLAPSEGTSSVPSILDASPSEIQDAVKTRGVVVEDPHGNLYSVLYATDSAVTIISSQYDSNTEPPTVLEPYMYTYEDQIHLRYPQEGGR